jgi:hypothetical protein
MIATSLALDAVAREGTRFFCVGSGDGVLEPVTPKPGDWFCEFDDNFDPGSGELRDAALVEYVGPDESLCLCKASGTLVPGGHSVDRHLVLPEGEEDVRRPRALILVLQGCRCDAARPPGHQATRP